MHAPHHAIARPAPAGAPLRLGARGDRFEQEADAAAERVLAGTFAGSASPAPAHLQRDPRSPYSPAEEGLRAHGDAGQDTPVLQRRPAGAMGAEPAAVAPPLAARIRGLQGGGAPLPAALRHALEPRFGHDFGRVRIHHDAAAQALAARVNARAFTLGPDIAFGPGQFDAGSRGGLRLLVHELAHVVQQGAAPRQGPGPALMGAPAAALQRVAWFPNRDTGTTDSPWGAGGPSGRILEATTDAGTAIESWRPDDGSTYWCHGYTFGGAAARGGPYSVYGKTVPRILQDDGWRPTYGCMARPSDILVFYDAQGLVAHSGIVRARASNGARVDEAGSTLQSKWGSGSLNTKSWEENALQYGNYRCYSKEPQTGVCDGAGAHER